jgi:hypothetical protein
VPGIFVDIDGMQARIRSVSGGRVVVDFNHPLAGRELHYRLKITAQVTDPQEKVKALIDHYGIKADISLKEGVLSFETEKPADQFLKGLIEKGIKEWVSEVKEIKFESKQPAEPPKEAPGNEKD